MHEAQNTALIRQLYEAFGRGDIQTIVGHVADGIVWNAVYGADPHVPMAGVRHGKAAVADFFKHLGENVTFSTFEPKEFIATGNTVIALGHYAGATPLKKTFESDFAMVFTVDGDKVSGFQEFCNTAAINAAFEP